METAFGRRVATSIRYWMKPRANRQPDRAVGRHDFLELGRRATPYMGKSLWNASLKRYEKSNSCGMCRVRRDLMQDGSVLLTCWRASLPHDDSRCQVSMLAAILGVRDERPDLKDSTIHTRQPDTPAPATSRSAMPLRLFHGHCPLRLNVAGGNPIP
jgi:hypothetical protein